MFRANSEAMLDTVAAGESDAATLAAAIAEATGADDDDDIVPAVVARTLVWTLITIFRATFAGLLAGEDPEQLAARMRPQAARADDRLAAGLGDYGVAGPAGDLAP